MAEENVVEIIESLLNTNWNTENVAKPTILRQWDPKRVDLRNQDVLLIYETAGLTREQADITYSYEDGEGFISVDIRTVVSEARFKALYAEIERIRKLKRKDPHTDWDRWDYIRRQLFHRPKSYRAVVDYKLVKYDETLG